MNRIKIMMVDDHQENLLALESVLTSDRYQLIAMRSGEDALRYILREDISDLAVILLDVQMPGLNGFDTAALIKKRVDSREIPIIFITAISKSIENVLRGYHVGSIDYIFKPFHPELLKMKVEAFVKQHEYHAEIKLQGEMLQRRAMELEEMNVKLARSEALKRMVSETSIDTILIMDDSGHIIDANSAASHMLGFRPEELTGVPISIIIPSLAEDKLPLAFRFDPSPQSLHKNFESEALRQDGTPFPVEYQIGEAALHGQRFFVCSIRDISEKKQLQKEQYDQLENKVRERTKELLAAYEKLRKSQERFKTMFTSSPCLISIRRLKDLKYINVNETWKSFSGYGDDVIGMTGDMLKITADPETGEYYTPGMVQRNLKIKYITNNNQIRDGLLSSEIIELDDGKCLLNVIVDVTDKVRYEKEMIRLGQLNLVGEMAAGIAHEIRNPMTTIRGFLQMSQRNETGIPSEYIDIMLGELDRANGIISEYLSLAKNKSSHLEAKALNPIIESLFPLLQAEAMMSGKNVRIEYGADGHLLLDEKEIRQMILNFAINGLEAMVSGGMLTIRTYLNQMETVMEISDEGSGIRTEYLDKLGTPFFTTKDKGTGLGLAVCYSIAARHHASIDVKSSSEGTTFSIRFRGRV